MSYGTSNKLNLYVSVLLGYFYMENIFNLIYGKKQKQTNK